MSAPAKPPSVTAPATSSSADTDAPTRPDAAAAEALAIALAKAFREHVRRAIGTPLDDSPTSLAFVDHYLKMLREPASSGRRAADVQALVAAEAGAYLGEVVRREIGGTWIGDGVDPLRLRLLVRPQFLYFAPVAQALEIVRRLAAEQRGDEHDADEPSEGDDAPLDASFHARTGSAGPDAPDDASWISERLAELPEVAAEEYYTLTCRFETLQLVLEMLAMKHASEGRSPREYGLVDYVDALAGT